MAEMAEVEPITLAYILEHMELGFATIEAKLDEHNQRLDRIESRHIQLIDALATVVNTVTAAQASEHQFSQEIIGRLRRIAQHIQKTNR